MRIGIIGFGNFGSFIAEYFAKEHAVICVNKEDVVFSDNSVPFKFFRLDEISKLSAEALDVIVLAVSISSIEDVLKLCPPTIFQNKLVIDVLSVKVYAKNAMMKNLPSDCDVLCTHPMFGRSSKNSLNGLPYMYDCVRISDRSRCECYLDIWRAEGCQMLEMSCAAHDDLSAKSQFTSHLIARTLQEYGLEPNVIDTANSRKLQEVTGVLCANSYDLFYGLYRFNDAAPLQVARLREALDRVEGKLKNPPSISGDTAVGQHEAHACPVKTPAGQHPR